MCIYIYKRGDRSEKRENSGRRERREREREREREKERNVRNNIFLILKIFI